MFQRSQSECTLTVLPTNCRRESMRRKRLRRELSPRKTALPFQMACAREDRDSRSEPRPRVRWQTRKANLRSEEHTSELQSPYDLVCRLLLEKKKKQQK